ncbi:MAG: tryptophan synthase subunit alpha, partial [Betaproteobacteria bacterium]
MSSRIAVRFQRLAAEGRQALIPFFTAGHPSRDSTVQVMHALARAGADVIELGVPFSDPMADGPAIQRSSEKALALGVGLSDVLQWVSEFRTTDSETPVVLM